MSSQLKQITDLLSEHFSFSQHFQDFYYNIEDNWVASVSGESFKALAQHWSIVTSVGGGRKFEKQTINDIRQAIIFWNSLTNWEIR